MNTSSRPSPSARRSALAAAALALLASCATTSAPHPPVVPDGVEVRVLLYSGRPDPTFRLADARFAELAQALSAARANPDFRGRTVLPSRLGYKGFLVQNPHHLGGLPERVAVYRGDIEVAGEPRRFLSDGGALEQWLVTRATEEKALDEHALEWIRQR